MSEDTYLNETSLTSRRKFLAGSAAVLAGCALLAVPGEHGGNDGAIAHIEAAQVLTAGATIATVGARHASYLKLLDGDLPFPTAFDEPVAPRAICNAVRAEFIVSCPWPYGPYANLDAMCARLPNTVTP